MIVHPIDYRYGSKEMKRIWSEESRIKRMIWVEMTLLKALANHGYLPKKDVEFARKKARKITPERVKEIEREIKHDIMALIKAISEICRDCGEVPRWVHFGVTSNDIIDTAVATQLRDTIKILEIKLIKLALILAKKADETKMVICLGRTHGQPALPTTYGFRFALWTSEILRHIERLRQMKNRLLVGQISGAVGTQSAFGELGIEIEQEVMKYLNLKPSIISSQIIPRDIYCEYIEFLANLSTTLEKIATNIRLLQRAETMEVMEKFEEKQVGSSTMPHKRNPIISEQICGLARVIRGFVEPQHQSSILWEERDLTNSSAERIILVEATVLVDHIINKTIEVLSDLKLNYENIKRNLEAYNHINMSESIMIELTKRGIERQKAHEILRRIAILSYEKNIPFVEALKDSEEIRNYLNEEEIENLIKPENYLGTAILKIENIVKEVKKLLNSSSI